MGVKHIVVGTPEEIDQEGARKVDVDGQTMLVARVDGSYVAFSNVCPHQQFELWASDIDGDQVHCVGHNYSFDIRTGACVWPPRGPSLATLPVEMHNGQICIRLES